MKITINGKLLEAREKQTILEVARENGIRIPTLCYYKDLNEIGACRLCLVEVKGAERLVASCNTEVREGMEILTESPRILKARRENLRLILSEHDSDCTTCTRNHNCTLQSLAEEFGLTELPFEKTPAANKWNPELPVIRTESKCIQCLRCVKVCEDVQGLGVWDLLGTGKHARVGVREGLTLDAAKCTYCGQCITHCPTGALRERDDTGKFLRALEDPEKTVVLQIAPAVRAAWGDGLGLPETLATEKRMAASFRALGVPYVFDTNFTADLTIMEEANEFLQKFTGKEPFEKPMFTSCCPGWVRFMKLKYPEMTSHLSSAKSPQQMFGALAKTYFAEKAGLAPENIFSVSIMPCTAKKYECDVKELNASKAGKDVDLVLTTREADRILKMKGIHPETLEEEEFDSPLGTGSGAAVIFGATGGVMEAALRTAYASIVGENPSPDAFSEVRKADGRKELTVQIAGNEVRACVASGLKNAEAVMEDVINGRKDYDFVEIMACPGGCAGGGGQPITDGVEMADCRGDKLYELDSKNALRFSHENPDVEALYRDYLGASLSEKAHLLLHTDQRNWTL